MALTFDQKAVVKERLSRGDSVFRIAYDLGHSPHTVRKIKKRLAAQLTTEGNPRQTEAPPTFIPVDLRLLVKMAAEEAIDLDYQVLLPVPLDVAARYVEIQEFFAKLKPLMHETAEAIRRTTGEQRTVEG